MPRLRSPEEANLRAPDAVVSLHVSFINAGSELIETNTFGANRRKLSHHFLEDDLEKINSAGVKLARDAREVTGRDVRIDIKRRDTDAAVSSLDIPVSLTIKLDPLGVTLKNATVKLDVV